MSFSLYMFCGACRSHPRKRCFLVTGKTEFIGKRSGTAAHCEKNKQNKTKQKHHTTEGRFSVWRGVTQRVCNTAAAAAAQASPRSPFPARGGGRGQAVFSGISLPRGALPLVSRLRLFLSPFQFRLMNCLRQSRMPTAASCGGATERAIRESKVARYLSCRLPWRLLLMPTFYSSASLLSPFVD